MKLWIPLLALLLMLGLAATAAQEGNAPTPEATDDPNATPPAEASADPQPETTAVVIEPLLDIPIPPPLEMTLPQDWRFGYDSYVYEDINGSVEIVQIAVYSGEVSGGTGWIVLVWGHDSVVNPFEADTPERSIWLDGLRLLHVLLFDSRCEILTDPQREYEVGGLPATGSTFRTLGCPESQPDTRGWFAALRVETLNFAFYAYVDPPQEPGSPAEEELQAILDSVVFYVAEALEASDSLRATQQALMTATPEATAEATPEATAETTGE